MSSVLSIAATGMAAQQLNVEVIANNIANMNTTGFKASRAEFTDLMYQTERLPGVSSSRGQQSNSRRRADRPRCPHGGCPQFANSGHFDEHRQQS